MRTQIIPEHALGLPWLEHFPAKGGPPEKTILDKSPFVIGRGESADLQVVSQGVSREHAAVDCEGRAIRIRDLGSTNGTFINGQRIKETDLHDGDMVQVADVEFAFHYGKLQARQAAATQILSLDADNETDCSDPASDLRRNVRRLHETLVSGCVRGRLKPIVDLRQGPLIGYEPSDDDVPQAGPESNSLLPAIPGRVAERLRHLRRMRGVEQAVEIPGEPLIFVNVHAAEVAAGRLFELANVFSELLAEPNRFVVTVPYAAAKEAAQTLAPGGPLRELGVAIALSEIGVGDANLDLLAEICPDFVRLAASLLRGVPGNSKNLAVLHAAVQAVGEYEAKVIAAGINNPSQRAACLEAGCALGQGMLFEERKRGDAASRKANLRGLPMAQDAFYLSLSMDSSERS